MCVWVKKKSRRVGRGRENHPLSRLNPAANKKKLGRTNEKRPVPKLGLYTCLFYEGLFRQRQQRAVCVSGATEPSLPNLSISSRRRSVGRPSLLPIFGFSFFFIIISFFSFSFVFFHPHIGVGEEGGHAGYAFLRKEGWGFIMAAIFSLILPPFRVFGERALRMSPLKGEGSDEKSAQKED